MSEEFLLSELEDLTPEQIGTVREVLQRLRGQTGPAPDDLDAREAAEIAELGKRLRGSAFIDGRHNIQQKYAQARAQMQPGSVDAEIEEAKDDRYALERLYRARAKAIKPNDPLKMRKKAELRATFRPAFRALGFELND